MHYIGNNLQLADFMYFFFKVCVITSENKQKGEGDKKSNKT